MTKRVEYIPFVGAVEIDDDESISEETNPRTQQEIADELGLSRVTVGKLETHALEKFREIFLTKYKKDDFI